MDVIVADLDGGSIRVPENLALQLLPEPHRTRTEHALSLVSFFYTLHVFAYIVSMSRNQLAILLDYAKPTNKGWH